MTRCRFKEDFFAYRKFFEVQNDKQGCGTVDPNAAATIEAVQVRFKAQGFQVISRGLSTKRRRAVFIMDWTEEWDRKHNNTQSSVPFLGQKLFIEMNYIFL